MKVADVMTKPPAYCSPQTNLAVAVEILWRHNCGVLPIVDSKEKVVGLVTDRDMCVALGTRNRLPSEITVNEVTSGKVIACKPDDDLRGALAKMAQAKVRRLPVLDAAGKLQGILSIDDVVLRTETGTFKKDSELSFEDIVSTLKSVYAPKPLRAAQQKIAAA
ncbi:MAG: CBS domain-containing protein [Acidobacteriia bacterium]|nr:CBS domain-containing protein [Terriglobia bacterium]